MAIVIKHIHDPLPLPRSLNPTLPEEVERVILKALAKNREDRYQTVSEMVKAFDTAAMTEMPEAALTEMEPQPTATVKVHPKEERRIPWWGWLSGGLVVLAVLVGLLRGNLPPTEIATRATATVTPMSPVTPIVTATVMTAPPLTGVTLVSTPVPSTPMQEPSSTPSELESIPMPMQAYGLPFNEPLDIIYDGSELWMLFDGLLVRLELVEAEGRFRAAQQQVFPVVNSLAWDASRGEYWTVHSDWEEVDIDLVDRDGNTTATFAVPQTFIGFPRHVAWDGENLWVTSVAGSSAQGSSAGSLYKLQPSGEGGELVVIDSYAQPKGIFNSASSGLTWDGSHLWLLVDNVLVKLDQAAQPVCRIDSLPDDSQRLWWKWRGVAWDGQFLWVSSASANQAYPVDPTECR
jgi:hypothetical protein